MESTEAMTLYLRIDKHFDIGEERFIYFLGSSIRPHQSEYTPVCTIMSEYEEHIIIHKQMACS